MADSLSRFLSMRLRGTDDPRDRMVLTVQPPPTADELADPDVLEREVRARARELGVDPWSAESIAAARFGPGVLEDPSPRARVRRALSAREARARKRVARNPAWQDLRMFKAKIARRALELAAREREAVDTYGDTPQVRAHWADVRETALRSTVDDWREAEEALLTAFEPDPPAGTIPGGEAAQRLRLELDLARGLSNAGLRERLEAAAARSDFSVVRLLVGEARERVREATTFVDPDTGITREGDPDALDRLRLADDGQRALRDACEAGAEALTREEDLAAGIAAGRLARMRDQFEVVVRTVAEDGVWGGARARMTPSMTPDFPAVTWQEVRLHPELDAAPVDHPPKAGGDDE